MTNEIYLITGMALVTFAIRYLPFAVGSRFEMPAGLIRALRYVPPTVLTAIIVPAVLMPKDGAIWFSYTNPYLIGALVAGLVGWVSRSLLGTIVIGMVAFLAWQWVVLSLF